MLGSKASIVPWKFYTNLRRCDGCAILYLSNKGGKHICHSEQIPISRYPLQIALHTTSCEKQPLSDKSLSRFRKRCYDYESAYGVDLLHDCLTELSGGIAKLMEINPRIKRMDSMMIAANIRKLSHIELLYTCVSKLVIYLHNNKKDALLKGMEHYSLISSPK